jgi:diketogulonate reductase-like aldo/keto reductase
MQGTSDHPQAYSPFQSTNSPLQSDEVVVEIAKKYELKETDVLLGWHCMFFITYWI